MTILHTKVSVIVPIYKVEKYLVQCLDSIVNQTLTDIEIILVDEGDKDACRYIIDHYEQTDQRVRTIHEKNGGYGASVNKGLSVARGEYIAIIESDDFIDKDMLKDMYQYAMNLGADMVKTPYFEYKDKTKDSPESIKICDYSKSVSKTCPANKTFSILDYPYQMSVHASLWSGIYRRTWMLERNIKFIEGRGAGYVDVGFRIDTFMNTSKAAWLNKPYYYYRLTNMESSTNSFALTPMLNRWREAHKDFKNKYEGTYEKVGPYLFLDEYLNTVGYIGLIRFTEAQFELLKENLNDVSSGIICNSKVLTDLQKQRALKVKTIKSYLEFNDFQNSLLPRDSDKERFVIDICKKKRGWKSKLNVLKVPLFSLRYDGVFARLFLFDCFRLLKFKILI